MMYLNLKEKGEEAEINPNLYCCYLVAGLTEHLHVAIFSVCGSMHIYSESAESQSVLILRVLLTKSYHKGVLCAMRTQMRCDAGSYTAVTL